MLPLLTLAGQGGNEIVDSLLKELSKVDSNYDSLKLMNKIAWESRNYDPEILKRYSFKARQYALDLEDFLEEAKSCNHIGTYYRMMGGNDSALHYFFLAKDICVEHDYQNELAKTFNNIGIVLKKRNQYSNALSYYDSSMIIRTMLGDSSGIAKCFNNKGIIHKSMGDFENSLEAYVEAAQIFKSLKSSYLANAYENIAVLWEELQDFDQAIGYYLQSRKIYQNANDLFGEARVNYNLGNLSYKNQDFDVAEAYYHKSFDLYSSLQDTFSMADLLLAKGANFIEQNNLDSANNNYVQALSLYVRYKDIQGQALTLFNLANSYKRQYLLHDALSTSLSGLEFAMQTRNKSDIASFYEQLAFLYNDLGEIENAFAYYVKYKKLSDTLFNENKAEILIDIQKQYETEKTKKELSQKDAAFQQEKAMKERSQFWLLASFASILLLLILSTLLLRYYRQKKNLAEKNEKLKQQEVMELLQTQDLKTMEAMIEGQEKERKRIGEDLHDKLGVMLSTIKMHFETLESKMDRQQEGNQEQHLKARELIDQAAKEVRRISHNMVSGVLIKFGLVAALKDLSDAISSTDQLKVDLLVFGLDKRLDGSLEIALYRVVQELLNNVIKHAGAAQAKITLNQKGSSLQLSVEDDGRGFDKNILKQKDGMGLQHLAVRVKSHNGTFTIDTQPGHGTKVRVELPLDV